MTTTRREFLATLGLGLGASAVRFLPLDAFVPGKKLSRIGIQLYTVRSLTATDLDGTLAQLAGIGYREVEFAGYFDRTPKQVKALLAANHLTSPSTHLGLPPTDDEWKKLVDDAKEIGHEWAVVPYLDAALRKTPDDWSRLADRFNKLAAITKASGMKFAYHNHDFEFVKVGDGTGLDVLLDGTDPKLVDFEMDIYWVVKGGGDPIALINRHPHRFPLMHIKDATAAPAHEMVDVGAGTINFGKIFAKAATSGMKHTYVEHDSPKKALQSATASYKYLAALNF